MLTDDERALHDVADAWRLYCRMVEQGSCADRLGVWFRSNVERAFRGEVVLLEHTRKDGAFGVERRWTEEGLEARARAEKRQERRARVFAIADQRHGAR